MKNAKRYLAVALSFALFLALPLAFTQEAAAASKTKVTQPSRVIRTYTDYNYDGSVAETTTSVTASAYDKKGLNTLDVYQYNNQITGKNVYTYNKSGYMTTRTGLDEKDAPDGQTVFTVKKGKTKAIADYDITGSNVTLEDYSKIAYKNGKISKVEWASADGKTMRVATYKKGVLTKSVSTSGNSQAVYLYDKYGNLTSSAYVSGSYTENAVYKNTYKDGKLVKTVWTKAYSGTTGVQTGLAVYTYKKGKLVKEVRAWSYSENPEYTYGTTNVYSYTKSGLIKTITNASTYTKAGATKVNWSETTAYQYQSVGVDKKCVKAVKEAMESYNYKNYLPGNELSWFE